MERIEHDEMGEIQVPATALYGAQTQRAVENFPISGMRLGREFVRALGLLKKAAAVTNSRLGVLDPALAGAIESAAEEVVQGRHDAQFVVDVFQTGSGTSTNMNANEVIARLATALCQREIHPNDHVNRSQSSNDVIPSALHIAAAEMLHRQLLPAMNGLEQALRAKAVEFADVVKIGRTHLQDALPLHLGDEFGAYARQLEMATGRVSSAGEGLFELALGGTAVGTGTNAPKGFGRAAAELIATWTALPFREAVNHFEAQSARDAVMMLAGALKAYAVALYKIGNDLRLLASGPRCGIGELTLPAVQPGSSIMPGKVNPVIIESTLMVCAQVVGYEAAITWCCAGGQLELNAMLPLIAFDVLEAIRLLSSASRNLADRCIKGVTANLETIAGLVDRSYALVTALTPVIGHAAAAAIAREAQASGATVREVAERVSGLPAERLDELLDLRRLADGE
jgi:fumarate hydratase, class II